MRYLNVVHAHHGVTMLHLPCMYVQRAFEIESKAADRLHMDGRSAVPSTALVNFLYVNRPVRRSGFLPAAGLSISHAASNCTVRLILKILR